MRRREDTDMALPEIVTRDEWTAARTALLEQEKEHTHRRDALSASRRRLPMVEIVEDYSFDGPDGTVSLLDLFEGRRQLVVSHFMFDPRWDDGCRSCSAGADEMSEGYLRHLHTRDTTLVYVSRAPLEKIEDYKRRKGWTFPWFSSYGSLFNYDFHVTLDESVRPAEYNYRSRADWEALGDADFIDEDPPVEMPGLSCFLRDGDRVFHTYSTYGRGSEQLGGSYYMLDLTALGRQEEWEEPKGRAEDTRVAEPNFSA